MPTVMVFRSEVRGPTAVRDREFYGVGAGQLVSVSGVRTGPLGAVAKAHVCEVIPSGSVERSVPRVQRGST